MSIYVGLDQWIAMGPPAPANPPTWLGTRGLAGCVAVMIQWGPMLSLAHVSSDCTQATWGVYEPALLDAFQRTAALREGWTRAGLLPAVAGQPYAVLVDSGEGTPWLANRLEQWLEGLDVEVERGAGNRCRCWLTPEWVLRWDPGLDAEYATTAATGAAQLLLVGLSTAAVAATPAHGD